MCVCGDSKMAIVIFDVGKMEDDESEILFVFKIAVAILLYARTVI